MKIAFDYDGTLTNKKYSDLAAKFSLSGNDVWIVTSRLTKSKYYENDEVFSMAEAAGIPETNIVFTQGQLKYNSLTDFDLFFDNDIIEIEFIEENTNSTAILV